jgi:hypothetical protein
VYCTCTGPERKNYPVPSFLLFYILSVYFYSFGNWQTNKKPDNIIITLLRLGLTTNKKGICQHSDEADIFYIHLTTLSLKLTLCQSHLPTVETVLKNCRDTAETVIRKRMVWSGRGLSVYTLVVFTTAVCCPVLILFCSVEMHAYVCIIKYSV